MRWRDRGRLPREDERDRLMTVWGLLPEAEQNRLIESYQAHREFLGEEYDPEISMRMSYQNAFRNLQQKVLRDLGYEMNAREMLAFLINAKEGAGRGGEFTGKYHEGYRITPIEISNGLGVAYARIKGWLKPDGKIPDVYHYHIARIFLSLVPQKNRSEFRALMREANLSEERVREILVQPN